MRGALLLSFIIIISWGYCMDDQSIMLDFNALYLPTQFSYFDQACKQLWSDLDFVLENPDVLKHNQTLGHKLFNQLTQVIERLQAMASGEESRTYLKDDVEYAINCIAIVFEKYLTLEFQSEINHSKWFAVALNACNQLRKRSHEFNS